MYAYIHTLFIHTCTRRNPHTHTYIHICIPNMNFNTNMYMHEGGDVHLHIYIYTHEHICSCVSFRSLKVLTVRLEAWLELCEPEGCFCLRR